MERTLTLEQLKNKILRSSIEALIHYIVCESDIDKIFAFMQ